MIAGSTLTGKLLDREHARFRRQTDAASDASGVEVPFPKEVARLRLMPIHFVIFTACVFSWGFCIRYKAPLAVLLIIQVIRK